MLKKSLSKSLLILTVLICIMLVIPFSFAEDVSTTNVTVIAQTDSSDVLSGTNDIYVGSPTSGSGDGSESNPYSSIATALSHTSSGDTNNIYIADGIYKESNLAINTANIDVSIIGSGNVVIDAEKNNRHFTITASGASVTMKNLKLINGYTTSNGGAINFGNPADSYTGSLTLDNVSFINNTGSGRSSGSGGAFRVASDVVVNVNNCLFDSNTAYYGGAFASSKDTTVVNSTFINNKAYGDGGAIWVSTSGDLVITGSVFESNSASRGGALGINSCNSVSITYSVLASTNTGSSTAWDYSDPNYPAGVEVSVGAAIWYSNAASAVYAARINMDYNWWVTASGEPSKGAYSKGLFLNNYIVFNATSDGSTVTADLTKLNTDNSLPNPELFPSLNVTFSGQMNPKSNLTVNGIATSQYIGDGDAQVTVSVSGLSKDIGISSRTIYVDEHGDNANDGSKENPVATITRAIAMAKSNSNIVKIFINNGQYNESHLSTDFDIVVVGQSNGGVIINGQNNTIWINSEIASLTNITFINARNSFDSSGGALINNGNLTLINCSFINNTIYNSNSNYQNHGAGIYSTGSLTVVNCYFENNKNTAYSESRGGAIYTTSSATIINTTFVNNRAFRVGAAIYSESNLTISGCVFKNNTFSYAGGGSGAAVWQSGGAISIDHSVFVNTVQDITLSSITGNGTINYNVFLNNDSDHTFISSFTSKYFFDVNYNYFGTNDNPSNLISCYENSTNITYWTILNVSQDGAVKANSTALINLDFTKATDGKNIITLTDAMPTVTMTLNGTIGSANPETFDLTQTGSNSYLSQVKGLETVAVYMDGVYVGNISFNVYDDSANMIFVSKSTGTADGDGTITKPFNTLAAAISKNDEGEGGKTICILDGSFYETALTVNKDLTILADNEYVKITGTKITNNANLELIELTFSSNSQIVNNANLTVSNCIFDQNPKSITNNANATIKDSKFTNGFGAVENKGNMEVFNSKFIQNSYYAVNSTDGNVTLNGNEFINNTNGAIVTVSTNLELTQNRIENSSNAPITVKWGSLKTTYIVFEDVTVQVNNPITLKATVSDDMGNPINGGDLLFTASGNNLVSVEVKNGTASYTYLATRDGEFVLSGNYSLDPNAVTADASLIVEKYYWFIGDVGYTTLQKAINAAGEGDVIEGLAGTYIYSTTITVNQTVTIQPKDGGEVILSGNSSRRIMLIDDDGFDVTLINLTFQDAYAYSGSGAAIYAYGNLTVINCMFVNNMAYPSSAYSSANGGAIHMYNNYDLKVYNSSFIANSADCGGAIYIGGYSDFSEWHLVIDNCTFQDNVGFSTGDTGGAIYIYAKTLFNITNSEFINNHANYYTDDYYLTGGTGGAIYIYSLAEGSIENCSFVENQAIYFGGAIYSHAEVDIINCTFKDNMVENDGGAVHGHFNIYNSTFIDNNAGNRGGALCDEGSSIIYNSTFTGNNAVGGGAIYTAYNYKYIELSTFKNNNATTGGAIYVFHTLADIFDSYFENNTATYGGAIANAQAWAGSALNDVVLRNLTFNSNRAVDGGAVYSQNEEGCDYPGIFLTDCLFKDNYASNNGGALYIDNMTMEDCVLTNNSARNYGGAIETTAITSITNTNFTSNRAFGSAAIDNTGYLTVNGSIFKDNAAERDAGALSNMNTATVKNSYFENNTAVRNGGAVKNQGEFLTVINTTFVANNVQGYSRGSFGGAIYEWTASSEITDSYFIDNTAETFGGAIYSGGGTQETSKSNITRTIFINNAAPTGGAVYAENTKLNVSYSVFINNTDDSVASAPNVVSIDINDNWWSVNNPDWDSVLSDVNVPASFAVLNVTCNPENIKIGQLSDLTFALCSNGTDTPISQIPKRNITVSAVGGRLSNTTGVLDDEFTTTFTLQEEGNLITAKVDNEVFEFSFDLRTPTKITVDAGNITFTQNATITVSINPKSANGNVIITVNGIDYNATLRNGQASVIVSNLKAGNYTVNAQYVGNTEYQPSKASSIFSVGKLTNYTISADIATITQGETATVIVTVPGDATGSVSVEVDGKTYSGTVNNAKANVSIPNLSSGEYSVKITYLGDANYDSNFINSTLTVNGIIVSAPDVFKYYGGSERFRVTVTDVNGNPIVNESVKITVNGIEYPRSTNENGTATAPLGLNSGTYNVSVEAAGQTIYSTVTINGTVEASNMVKVFKNASQFIATFLDTHGNLLTKTNISFNINGIYYVRTTNDKGVARLNINLGQGTYAITAINPASGEMHTNNITVLPRIIENNDVVMYYKNGTQYLVKLTDERGNVVGAGVEVTFNINGMFYTRKTNANGIARLNINLQAGNYIITAQYAECSVSNNIRILPVLSANNLTMSYKDGSRFEAKLLDGHGNPFKGENVTFNINGIFYPRTTDADGIARLNINLPSGKYIITSSYNNANTANTITIS